MVSWSSLDHGGPVVVRVAADMVPGWNQIPLFSNRFEGYYFFIWHPWQGVAPPAANSILGPNDTAMLAVLEASLPAMNQQVADSMVRARNAPLPGPDLPGSKRFWRVKVDPDVDTDSDGSPDWAEFEIVARGTGMLVPGVTGDPFNPDTNGDGIPDGEQLDADGDGTPDAKDADASDNTAYFPLGPVPRYAMFPITNASPPADALQALQINDKGRVLYENGTWCGGAWTPLVAPTQLNYAGYPQTAFGVSINDNDVILGNSSQQVGPLANEFASVRCFWNTPAADPQLVKSNNNLGSGYAGWLSSSLAFHGDTYQPQLSNDNRFTAHFCHWQAGPNGTIGKEIFESAVWTLPAGGQPLSTHAPIESSILFHGPGVSWGYTVPRDAGGSENGERKGQVLAPDPLPELPFIPYNVVSAAGGLMAFPRASSEQSPQALIDGHWQASDLYKGAFDMASDGTAVGSSGSDGTAPILLNGKWLGIGRTAPGVTTPWDDATVTLLDTTPGGWILAGRGNTVPQFEHAILLPIKVAGKPEDEVLASEATGVDEFSIGSPTPGTSVQDRIWVMAPLTEGQTRFTLKAPLNSETSLKLKGHDLRFDGATEKILTDKENPVTIESRSSNEATRDVFLELSLGGTPSATQPLGVKIMKDRIVRVRPFLVIKRSVVPDPANPGQHLLVTNPPDVVPSASQLQTYLNAVFRPQLNTTFVVEAPVSLQLEWDANGNGSLDPTDLVTVGPEQQGMMDLAAPYQADADIKVFFLGTEKKIYLNTAWGLANRDAQSCWVVGDSAGSHPRTHYQVMQTTAHEIGHLLVGYGHPDAKGPNADKGLTPLPGTDHKQRLMHSGEGLGFAVGTTVIDGLRGHRLVKGEWDEAEKWMFEHVDK